MTSSFLFMRRLWQVDNFHFAIEWNDNQKQVFRLNEVQNKCPCASCYDEIKGQRLANSPLVQENVKAVVIRQVGRYGLRIQFTSGCSAGIYSFDHLHQINQIRIK